MSTEQIPQPKRQALIRGAILHALEEAINGEYLSIVILAETTDEGYALVGTAVDNEMGMSGFMHSQATLMALGQLDPGEDDDEGEEQQQR
jgi:hypothetical protein